MTWAQMHEAILRYGAWLAADGIPQRADEGPPLTVEAEVRADEWLRHWCRHPHVELPPPDLCRALVPRFRMVLAQTLMAATLAPEAQVPDTAAELEGMLIGEWYSRGRIAWLRELPVPPE